MTEDEEWHFHSAGGDSRAQMCAECYEKMFSED